jgi:DnaK suppressor protein
MLTDKEKAQLGEVLKSEKQRLLHNARDGLKLSMERGGRDTIGRDSIDESMEEELFSTELRLRDREKYLLNKIDGAMERLKAGTIDECEDCGEKISFKRLMARPVTTLCIDCKEEKEKEEVARSQIVGRGGGSDDHQMPDDGGDE